ncbi:hypothetical protein FNF29_04500 [Cafeteria roenbergensis]|uniref:Folate receptor-like domain-containing protein n=1 Tax=Cafeteria roenbergensis TaxID=33653 RepID=A0A5A8D8A4_CAFRO|nr:hypothetical protein FNF29_04500 [Cafeteria roenbergensis]KAA0161373.1 hypothetical protein FNF31_03832 [Cafeteria roenbergensis]KAA0161752.1 hypothetical protein FNF28_04939 [Cafeteria roenbergensis]|eukprot:KAA0151576.1 hypothetical protein FNF29_04500 [Cafeteria roenbergensis]
MVGAPSPALGALAVLAVAAAVFSHASAQDVSPSPTPAVTPSPTPGRPEEQICDYTTYFRSYAFEITEGFDTRGRDCEANVLALQRLQFGPPTEWEIFTSVCKGDCKAYTDRITRILGVTDCDCSRVADPLYRCPATPTDYLCRAMQICLDYEQYMADYCSESACGRFATNEDDWRTERAKCPGSAATPALLAGLAALVAVFATAAAGAAPWRGLGGA